MIHFKRNLDPKHSLDIGNKHYFREMWLNEMKEHYNDISDWFNDISASRIVIPPSMGYDSGHISYSYSRLDRETGMYEFIEIDQETQNQIILYSIFLPDLVKQMKEWKEKKKEREYHENSFRGKKYGEKYYF